jgi:2',3'-cyclic-nucleotide 2'-phosphodiesterase (5'-nucleotidase family)
MGGTRQFTILHSNDMHGDFLAEQAAGEGKLIGGLPLLSGYINKVRAEEENVLYVIAGDMLQGSIIDSDFKGTSTMQIMNYLAPDVVTLGNPQQFQFDFCLWTLNTLRALIYPANVRFSVLPLPDDLEILAQQ